MTRTIRALSLAIGAIAAAAALPAQQTLPATVGARFVAGGLIGGSVVTGEPYSADAVTDTTQALTDGTTITQHSTATVYRDSQGRERREQTLASLSGVTAQSQPLRTVFISDPVAGANYSLNPDERTALKLPALPAPPPPAGAPGPNFIYHQQVTIQSAGPGGAVSTSTIGASPIIATAGIAGGGIGPVAIMAPGMAGPGMAVPDSNATFVRNTLAGAPSDPSLPQPDLPQPNVEQLGSKLMSGVNATGTRTTFTIPAGQIGNDRPIAIVDERWFSSDLQVIVQSTHTDPRMGTTTYSLQNVSRAEPSPNLFQVPADYTITDAPEPTLKFSAPRLVTP